MRLEPQFQAKLCQVWCTLLHLFTSKHRPNIYLHTRHSYGIAVYLTDLYLGLCDAPSDDDEHLKLLTIDETKKKHNRTTRSTVNACAHASFSFPLRPHENLIKSWINAIRDFYAHLCVFVLGPILLVPTEGTLLASTTRTHVSAALEPLLVAAKRDWAIALYSLFLPLFSVFRVKKLTILTLSPQAEPSKENILASNSRSHQQAYPGVHLIVIVEVASIEALANAWFQQELCGRACGMH